MKGMQKIRRGKNFAGVVLYALRPDSHHQCPPNVIGGNMMGDAERDLIAEFNTTKTLRPDVVKPVWHNSLRLPKNEALTNAQWVAIADDYMKRMGFAETHLRCYIIHDDADGQHIHIIASRIALVNGKLYLGKNENLISTHIIQQLERDYSLIRTKGPELVASPSPASPSPKPKRKKSRNEAMLEKRTGELCPKTIIQEALDTLLIIKLSTTEFVQQLAARNIMAVPNIASTGKINGFSFEYSGIAFKASQLGKCYSWSALQNRFDYQPERDNDFLFSLKASVSEAIDMAITTAPEITTAGMNSPTEALIQDNRAGQGEYAIVSKVVLSEADTSDREAYATEAVIEAGAGGKEAHATEAVKETHRKNTLSMGLTGFRWLETIPYLNTIISILKKLRIPTLKRRERHTTITGGMIIEITALTPKNTIQTTPKSHPSSFPM
ncbi:Relaxase/mobilization nuclease family protein [Pectobacterium parmentieri WPP163]|uniref:relaxase/mobilization nuclease domain-containing protein n=1 Tax=Pectobacterium parmentieri TaxID=1905730 RepID=UPI0001BA0DC6|nr:relaxase/mobilization nuclease domain-containing protein [Pectobacterium parmentieri]ACX87496.1 Relaxase/mobilization nuclease family protein [Pectobacterium parmentieri WPP163]